MAMSDIRKQAIEAFGADYMASITPQGEWMNELTRNKRGVEPCLSNIIRIFENDCDLQMAELNEFTQETVTRVNDKVNGELWTDRHDAVLRYVIEQKYGMAISGRDLADALLVHTQKHRFHPVREYLAKLRWDGVERAGTLFCDYLGSPADDYHVEAAELTLMGAVTRVMEPGHKFDFVPILEGLQGRRKSTFIEKLARGWFAGLDGNFDDRTRLVEKMQGAWILEVPELSAFSKSEVQIIKDFVSCSSDKVRLAYGRRAAMYPRQSIMIGSTNEDQYLKDTTGNRRFWPIKCNVDMIDTDKLEENIDQIWAEAYDGYQQARIKQPHGVLNLSLRSGSARDVAKTLQDSRRAETPSDAWAGVIAEWLEGRDKTCLIQIWCECFGRLKEDYTTAVARTLAEAARAVEGWEMTGESHRFVVYGKQRVFEKVSSSQFQSAFQMFP